jgi:diguanylate cyclase (GGDEF)-like protein
MAILIRSAATRTLLFWIAISVALQAQQYVFRPYRQDEGLKNLSIKGLTTDRFGFLWAGTENGVYRFLGSNFELYSDKQGILDRDIEVVFADPNGTVWAGTEENLYRWNGQRFLPAGRDPIHLDGWQSIVAEDERHLLVIDKSHLYRLEHDAEGRMLSYLPVFSNAQTASIPELENLVSITEVVDETGKVVWAGCGRKICSWRVGHEDHVAQWGQDKGVVETRWQAGVQDRGGTLWMVGEHQVAVLLHGTSRFVARNLPDPDSESVSRQTQVIEDSAGRVIIPTKEGLARWEGSAWRLIGSANGLHSNHITGMAFDAAGDLWLGSLGLGIYHWIGYENWEGWGDGMGLPSSVVWGILPIPDGRVIAGTEDGTAWIDPRTGAAGPLFAGRSWTFGQVATLGIDPGGQLWAGTFSGGVLRIDPKSGHTVQTASLPAFIMTSFEDSAGDVYFSTKQGLYQRAASDFTSTPARVKALDPLIGYSARVEKGCQSSDGALWFLGANRLVRFKNGVWTAPPIDGLRQLRGSLLSMACPENGEIWVAGDDGTWQMTPGPDRIQAWELESPPELRNVAPLAVLVDRRGWVWEGTDSGLLVWNHRDWRHLTQESGLIWDDTNQGALREGPDGSLWVGTSGGVAHLLHPERVFDSPPVSVSVTNIQRGNSAYPNARDIKLDWSSLPLRFQISSPATRNRSELVLSYRMQGLQPDWVEAPDGVAVFSALPPGRYTFEAIARNPGLNASSEAVRVPVRILPPWWRTNWFYALCALACLLLLYLGDRIRARNLRERSLQLENLVSERTRELEASQELLRIQATYDGLTGMLNRVAILRALGVEIERARRQGSTLIVALIDLDHFKRVNDVYGHLVGDDALRWFAGAVGAAIRAYDHAGRYGGEEFLLVLTEVPPEFAEQRVTALHSAVSNLTVRLDNGEFTLNCSIGATFFDPSNGSPNVETLLSIADQALYEAKSAGRNRVIFRDAAAAEPRK